MSEAARDFFKEHDAEGERAEEEERAFPEIGDGMVREPISGRKIDESGIQKEEGIVETCGDGFDEPAHRRAVEAGHHGGNRGAAKSRDAEIREISFRNPFARNHVLDPVADDEIETRFAHGKQRIQEIIHFAPAAENEEGNDRHDADEEKIEADEVEIVKIFEISHHRAPERQHEEETDINVEEIIRRRHRGRVEDGEKVRGREISLRHGVEIDVI